MRGLPQQASTFSRKRFRVALRKGPAKKAGVPCPFLPGSPMATAPKSPRSRLLDACLLTFVSPPPTLYTGSQIPWCSGFCSWLCGAVWDCATGCEIPALTLQPRAGLHSLCPEDRFQEAGLRLTRNSALLRKCTLNEHSQV